MKSADPIEDGELVTATSETTPLLSAPEVVPVRTANGNATVPSANGNLDTKTPNYGSQDSTAAATPTNEHDENDEGEERPMPVLQILLLCYASLAEPVAYFSIFPFINEMIFRLGSMPESSVGFWTGLIESLFSLVQMVLMIFYGRAADRWGRKPVLVFSLTGVGVATALFGMSQQLWQMIAFRCLAGCFAGSVVTVRTMISENCTKLSQARAFSWYMFTKNMGIFLGPVIGGGLANIAEQYPNSAFGHSAFFQQYPYALATWVAGGVVLTAALACQVGLNETLKVKMDSSGHKAPPMSTWEVTKSPGVPMVLFIFGFTSVLGLGYTAVSPVFMFTSVEKGGLGFSDQFIALFLAVAGASQALWMLFVFPPLQKRFGTGNVLRGTVLVWPIMMAGYAGFNEMRRHGLDKPLFIIFWPLLVLGSGISMAYACIQLTINDVAPSSQVLATINALALTVNSGVRAVTPIAFTSLFAVGIKIQWADGHLVWIVLVTLALGLNVAAYFLPANAEGRYQKRVRGEGDE